MSNLVPDPPLSEMVTRFYIVKNGGDHHARALLRSFRAIIRAGKLEKLDTSWKLERERTDKMNKLNRAAAITNVIVVIIMTLLAQACYLKGKHAGTNEMMNHIYPMSGIVTEVNRQENCVVVTDSTGNKWEFDGADDWHTNDIAAMIMRDNGTEEIYDDEIIDVQYDGWVE